MKLDCDQLAFGDGGIELVKMKRPTESMRWATLLIAREWGYHRENVSNKQRCEIAATASRLVAYDCGFKKFPKGTNIKSWNKMLEEAIGTGKISLGALMKDKSSSSYDIDSGREEEERRRL
jgi:hypothetical protein